MDNSSNSKEKSNLREEARIESRENGSVEFIPGDNELAYHFKLKDFSSKGLGIMVRKDSKVLRHIKVGDIINMRYHPDKATLNPVPHKTQIRHITEPEPGNHKDHMLVGLLILE